jgi:butyryl-CoA dehydrogenase
MKNLQDKVIVITGAGSGIGRELALQFAAENCRLGLSDINQEGLEKTASLLNLGDDRVATYIVDVSDLQASEKFALDVVQKFGQVDVMINNAGLASVGLLDEVSYEAFQRVINVNM